MFKFGFSFDGEEEVGSTSTTEFVEQNDTIVAAAANVDQSALRVEKIGEYVAIENGVQKTECADTISKVTSVAEVLSGVYEGGMKKWECSDDLMHFLSTCCEDKDSSERVSVKFDFNRLLGARMLDLGCGHGYPGLLCLKKGAGMCAFQDLNEEVLAKVTVANVLSIAGTQVMAGSESQHAAETLQDSVVQLIRENARKQVLLDYPQYNEMKKAIEQGESDECTLDFVAEVEQEIADKDAQMRDQSVEIGTEKTVVLPRARFFSGPWGAPLSALMNAATVIPGAELAVAAQSLDNTTALPEGKYPEEEYPNSERQAVLDVSTVARAQLTRVLHVTEQNASYKGGVQEQVVYCPPALISEMAALGYDLVSYSTTTATMAKRLQAGCAAIKESVYRYDLILSADTIYSEAMIPILVQSIRETLSAQGSALIAAKRYYFGVGGSTAALRKEVERFGDMKFEVVKVYQDGNSNIREMVQVTWTKNNK